MPDMLRRWWAPIVGAVVVMSAAGTALPRAATSPDDGTVTSTLERAASRVQDFFLRAQSLVCTEKVFVQYLNAGLTGDGLGRAIESELRLSWDQGLDGDGGGAAEAMSLRKVMKVNGRAPRKNDRRSCTTAERHETSPQPLSMLLPGQREKYTFTAGKPARLEGREAITVEFREIEKPTGEVEVDEDDEDCLTIHLNGGMRGRLWLDAETHDVLRLDQHLSFVTMKLPPALLRRPGVQQDSMLDRYDTSIRFKRVRFEDPPETIVLPVSQSILMVTRGSNAVRQRTQTSYANYKRFLTGGRLVAAPPSE